MVTTDLDTRNGARRFDEARILLPYRTILGEFPRLSLSLFSLFS